MTGPSGLTIQQVKNANPETLWQFFVALPGTMEAQLLYGLLIAGVVGMSAHYLIRWLNGDIEGNIFSYLFRDYPKRTALAFAGVVGAALTAIASDVFVTTSGEFVGWLNVLWLGLTNGYAADSLANKGRAQTDAVASDPPMVSVKPRSNVTGGPASGLASLVLGVILALGFAPEARAQAGNLGAIILPSAARTAAQVNSADQNNQTWSGAHVTINVTAFTAGTYTPKIQGKDPVSGTYYDVLVGPAIGATGITVLKVYPGIVAVPNGTASDILPRTWRVQLNGAGGQSMTFSVGANLQQ